MTFIWLGAVGLLVSNTVGAGIFALPYVSQIAGWGTFFAWLVGLGALLLFMHAAYGEALDRVPGHHRLTGLVELYLPRRVFGVAAIAILGGLALTLVIYIILAGTFMRLVFPGLPYGTSMALMWALGSLPLFFKLRRMVALELAGAVALAAIILFIVFRAPEHIAGFFAAPPFASGAWFFPFAPVLFALAGWNAIGPMREHERRVGVAATPNSSSIAWGTVIVLALYAAFAIGIVGSAASVTPDTLSGLTNWSRSLTALLGIFGLVALWTSYVPVAAEVRDSLKSDFKWSDFASVAATIFAPIVLLSLGLTNFFSAIGLAGGVFLSAQYVLIALVTLHALRLPPLKRFTLTLTAILFCLAAVYELYAFVVR